MRYLAVAIIAVALFAAGFLAADMVRHDADAQGTWHVEYFPFHDDRDVWAIRGEASSFIESLPADCEIDFEFVGEVPYVAYACPD